VAIFSQNNLNTIKHLNFLTFAKAFLLYTEITRREDRKKLKPELDKLIITINNKRTDFDHPQSHKIKITSNWLLGFTEGDGSFFYNKLRGGSLGFQISQKGNSDLMIAIRDYLINLAQYNEQSAIYVRSTPENVSELRIEREYLIKELIIPLFSTMNFQSKKLQYFEDWVSIAKIREKGLHYLPEGKELIERIYGQMNNNRLSTSGKPIIERSALLADIGYFLSRPSNYERDVDGRNLIISEGKYQGGGKGKRRGVQIIYPDGKIAESFKSGSDCAKFLGLPIKTFFWSPYFFLFIYLFIYLFVYL
jgi:hypothetical protein